MSLHLLYAVAAVLLHRMLAGAEPGPWQWFAIPFALAGTAAVFVAAPVVVV